MAPPGKRSEVQLRHIFCQGNFEVSMHILRFMATPWVFVDIYDFMVASNGHCSYCNIKQNSVIPFFSYCYWNDINSKIEIWGWAEVGESHLLGLRWSCGGDRVSRNVWEMLVKYIDIFVMWTNIIKVKLV